MEGRDGRSSEPLLPLFISGVAMALHKTSARIFVHVRRLTGHAASKRVAAVFLPQPARLAGNSASDSPACRGPQRVWPWGSRQLWAGTRAQDPRGSAAPRRAPLPSPCSAAVARSSAEISAPLCLGGGAGKRPLSGSPKGGEQAELAPTTWVDAMPVRVATPPPLPCPIPFALS